ncbi:MAG TPA: radical SAM protein [Rhizomicrobium sp.]|jgi:radical SAM superfamily enzyme YgiQ (UPF0313 family)
MAQPAPLRFKPNLLCIAPPPFSPTAPPAGASYLLGYLKSQGCLDFDFLDLRLGVPDCYSPTYTYTGAYAEAYVHDIPDLPLVLQLIQAFESGAPLVPEKTELMERYCLERGISLVYLQSYLYGLDRYFAHTFEQIPDIRFIGFSVWTTNYLSTLMAAAHLKRRRNPPVIVAGGPQVSSSEASAQLGLGSGLFDVVAVGEGEQTLLDVYNAFARDGRVGDGIAGTLVKTAPGVFARTPRALMRLTTMPAPSFAEMHISAYQTDDLYRTVPLQFSRGCTDKCEFCSEWKFWERFRTDTAEHTVDQIERVKRDYGATFITFMDSLLNGIPRRLVELCELMLRRSVDIRWSSFMRAQMDAKTAALLARAGCHDVFIGVESFSDETLELMRKRRTSADNLQAVEAFLDAGIDVTAGFVPGFPGDSRDRFVASALVLRDLQQRYRGRFEVNNEAFVVQPGAPLFNKLDQMGLTGQLWAEDYLDIAPAYRDITARILCTVQGESQGLERVGRLSILHTITEDARSNSGFAFARAEGEDLSTAEFVFTHLRGGWSLASRKSEFGHVYSLIVNEEEEAELGDLDFANGSQTGAAAGLLARLERAHVVPPSRHGLRAVRGLYQRTIDGDCRFSVSPFVVARAMDWRQQHGVLISSILNQQVSRRRPRVGDLLRFVLRQPRSEEELWTFSRRKSLFARTELRREIERLKEDGILVICERAERLQRVEAVEAEGASAPVAESEAATEAAA